MAWKRSICGAVDQTELHGKTEKRWAELEVESSYRTLLNH